jgi:hypothetical protein
MPQAEMATPKTPSARQAIIPDGHARRRSAGVSPELARHVQHCPECRDLYETLIAFSRVVHGPSDDADHVYDALRTYTIKHPDPAFVH